MDRLILCVGLSLVVDVFYDRCIIVCVYVCVSRVVHGQLYFETAS